MPLIFYWGKEIACESSHSFSVKRGLNGFPQKKKGGGKESLWSY